MTQIESQRPVAAESMGDRAKLESLTSTVVPKPPKTPSTPYPNKEMACKATEDLKTAIVVTTESSEPVATESSEPAATESGEAIDTATLKAPSTPPPYVSLTNLPKLSRVFSANGPILDDNIEVAQPAPTQQMQATTNTDKDSVNDLKKTVVDPSVSGLDNVDDPSEYVRCSLDERRKSMHFNSAAKNAAKNTSEPSPTKPMTILPYTVEIIQATLGCVIGFIICGVTHH
ncbi:hypothetical protein BDF19DRAFT_475039 [Syncephalis fuscata]|nr:hypothetical protein BDF19DRAFT_475039 [Syncephalis fuscata]